MTDLAIAVLKENATAAEGQMLALCVDQFPGGVSMTDLDLTALRAKAEAATLGEWRISKCGCGSKSCMEKFVSPPGTEHGSFRHDDAEFIVAAQPRVALALLDRVEKAEAALVAIGDASFALASANDEISRLRSLLARAGEALEPFARSSTISDDCAAENGRRAPFDSAVTAWAFSCGELRTARTIAREIEEAIGHE